MFETSIHDLLVSLEKMQDYDFVLSDLGYLRADLQEEKAHALKENDN